MSVLGVDAVVVQHWIFKHPPPVMQNAKSRAVNYWLQRNFHQLTFDCGDVEPDEIGKILKSLKFDCLLVKGEHKRKIIGELVPHVEVINMENSGCPRLELITGTALAGGVTPCCTYHMNLNPKQCTLYKVFALRNWFVNYRDTVS